MEKETFKYNAFISYRHSDLDKYVAENLHRLIETYKMPQAVIDKYHITDNNIRRVFRDQDELPLSSSLEDPIIKALKDSEYLIVICSPRLRDSLWCKKEIENFISFHDRNNILCVLVEGEPSESFPEELLYHYEEVTNKSGKVTKKKVYTEPLALDVRGKNKKEIYKKLKSEIVRVMAPLYKLDYDDIKRRHEEREMKRRINIFRIASIISIIFAIYSFILFYNIYKSNEQLKYDQSVELAKSAITLLNNDDRNGAVKKAYQSVTRYNNIKMPVTAEGIYELTQSLGLYSLDSYTYNYNAVSQLDTLGTVKLIKTNKDGNLLLSYDESDEIILWDLKTEKRIKTIKDTYSIIGVYPDKRINFIGNKAFGYINKKGEAVIDDLDGNEITKIGFKYGADTVIPSKDGKYIAIQSYKTINIYETENYSLVGNYEVSKEDRIVDSQYFDDKGENLLFITKKEDSSNDINNLIIVTYNIKNNKVTTTYKTSTYNIGKILFHNNNAYVLGSRYIDVLASDCILISYNYKNGKKNYQFEDEDALGCDMEMTFSKDGYGTIMLSDSLSTKMFDLQTGKKILSDYRGASAAFIHDVEGAYRVFTKKGDIIWIKNSDTMYFAIPNLKGYFNFRLNSYEQFLYANKTYIAITGTENRIIIYGHYSNDDIQEVEYKKREYTKLEYKETEEIIEDYDFENKYLIYNMFYSDDKKYLFVVYKHSVLEIYNNDTKKLIKTVEGIDKETKYFIAKTNNDQYIIGDSYSGYVLNKNFELFAKIDNLHDYYDGKLILSIDRKTFYEVPLYSSEEVIAKANEYLKSKE